MRAIVVGAAIGGLAAAIALEQAGVEPIVTERAPELREAGFGLVVSANAVTALALARAPRRCRRAWDEGSASRDSKSSWRPADANRLRAARLGDVRDPASRAATADARGGAGGAPAPRDDLRDELATSSVRTDANRFLSGQDRPPDAAPSAEEPGEGHSLLDDLKAVFVEHRWPFTEVRGAPVLITELSGPLERWKFFAQVVETQRLVAFYSVCPMTVPEDRRMEIADYLTRANYGLALGNFELDFDDGEIRFKTVLQVEGELSATLVKKLVRANGMAMETYLPGIGAVITGMPALPAIERRTTT